MLVLQDFQFPFFPYINNVLKQWSIHAMTKQIHNFMATSKFQPMVLFLIVMLSLFATDECK